MKQQALKVFPFQVTLYCADKSMRSSIDISSD